MNRLWILVVVINVMASSVFAGVKSVNVEQLTVKSNSTDELTKAIHQAKKLLIEGNDVVVQLSAGTYYLTQPLNLTHHSQHSLSLIGSPSGTTKLSGAIKLTPKWQKHNDFIIKAQLTVDNVDQLFVAGEPQIRARYPNYQADAKVFNGFSEDALSPERTKHWKNPYGAYVHALHKGRWGGMHYQITGKLPDGNWQLRGGEQNNRPSPLHKKYRYVENVFEELDAPKEWFFDVKSQTLYFYPESNGSNQVNTIEVPQLKHLIEIVGTQQQPANKVTLSNINFSHTQHTFMDTKEPLLRSDWTIYRGAAVKLAHAENINIQDNDFIRLGGNAIAINRFAKNIKITGNHISQIGAGAINFVGDPSAVRSPSFTYKEFVKIEDMDLAFGPKNNLYPQDSLVENNLIHDIGLIEKQVAGVQLSMSKSITIRHNSIYRVPRAGINASEGTWGGHLIEFNDVFDTVLETGDHGAFNSWGRDRFWHPVRKKMNALKKSHPDLYKKDAIATVVIRNNRFHCDHGWDIDLDDGSSNYDIYNNVMLNGGLKLREGFDRNAYNNILINNSFHPHVWFEDSGDKFSHNIVLVGHKPVSSYYWGDEVDYNLFMTETALKEAQALNIDEHSAFGDPMFIDAASGDYRVKPNAMALKLGFKNFSMNEFGVTDSRLKLLAETPKFPELFLAGQAGSAAKIYDFLGAKIKSIETLGEQSATGVSEMAGAMVLSVNKGSIMGEAGIKENDVILEVFGKDQIVTAVDLLNSYQTNKWRGKLMLTLSRNQSLKKITVSLGK